MSSMKSPEELSARKNGKEDKKTESEELPVGWTVEVKTRKGNSGKKVDRYYTDPVTKYTFRSLRDVQRYLKTGHLGRLAKKPKEDNCVDTNLEEKSGEPEGHRKRTNFGEKSTPDSSHRASKRLATMKHDLSPTVPPQRKTRQATKLAGIKTDTPPSPPEATKLAGIKADTPPSPPEATKLARTEADTSPSPPEAAKLAGTKADTSPPPLEATKLAGIKADTQPSPPEAKTRQATKLAGIKAEAPPSLPEAKTHQARKLAGIKTGASPVSPPERKTRQATKLAGIKTDAKPPPLSPPEPKTRKAKRLAGVEVNEPPGLPPSLLEPKTRRRPEKEPETKPEEKSMPTASSEATDKNDGVTLPPDQPPPAATPPASLAGNLPVIEPVPQEQTLANIKPESPMNFSLNDLWTDPCIEFAVKTLTGAIPFGDLNNSSNFVASPPLEVPLEELWTDPCIEFAVKTLTGAIPVTGDLSVQDYLHNQPTCSSDPNNFCQPEVLSKHFETTGVHNSSNGGGSKNKVGEKVVPMTRNGGLEVSGNGVVVPQQVKGGGNSSSSIGQCSRGRFYG